MMGDVTKKIFYCRGQIVWQMKNILVKFCQMGFYDVSHQISYELIKQPQGSLDRHDWEIRNDGAVFNTWLFSNLLFLLPQKCFHSLRSQPMNDLLICVFAHWIGIEGRILKLKKMTHMIFKLVWDQHKRSEIWLCVWSDDPIWSLGH